MAKVLLSAARSGLRAVHLVAGDPFGHDAVVKEVQAVARTAVPFEVVPGVEPGRRRGHLRRRAAAGRAHRRRRRRRAPRSTSTRWPPRSARGSVALAVDAGDLAAVRDGLLAAGRRRRHAGRGDRRRHRRDPVHDDLHGGQLRRRRARLHRPGRAHRSAPASAHRDKLGWWENRPLYGWKVLVPRTKEQAGAMSARLRAYGAIPCEVPTIAVEPPRTPAQMERAIKGLVDGRYAWVIFTSVNAVRAVWEKFAEHGLDARHFGGVKIACIGEATADAVRAFGIQPELVPAGEQSSEGLLAEFSPHDEILDPVGRVLLPRADIATETLAAGLTERGWEVDDVTAYRTVRAAPPPAEIRDAIKSGGFDAVLFTSSSTVRNLVGIAGKPHARTVVAVIGPKTAETAAEFGLRVDVQPRARVGARPGRGARRVRRRAAREAGRDAGQAAPRLEGAGADRAAVPVVSSTEGVHVVSRTSGPRRLRTHARRCAGWSPRPGSHPAELVLPMFVKEGLTEPRPIASLPGRRAALPRLAAQGGGRGGAGRRRRASCSSACRPTRDAIGSGGIDPDGILNVAIRDVVAEVGDATVVMSDLCLDEFTSHGHCGVLAADGAVDNDATLARYAEMAVAQAAAGVHVVGPSGMMDGQVGVVRRALDAAGYTDVAILAYAAKYASAFYGPFRDAVESTLEGDRTTYQQDPAEPARGAARGRARRRRGRRHRDGQAGAAVPGRDRRGARQRWTCRSPPTRSPASTRWSRRPPPTAGSTASGSSWRR